MARFLYFSFDYNDVKNFKVNVVRNTYIIHNAENTFMDGSIWETEKTKSPKVIMSLINKGLNKTSVTTILVGDETANRRWINYEIIKSFVRGNGILAIHINRIRGKEQVISKRGLNPLDRLGFHISEDGKKIKFLELVKGKWEIFTDLPEINNTKSTALLYKNARHSDDFGKFFKFSDQFETYCWIMDEGHKNFSAWIEIAAKHAGRIKTN